MGRNRTLFVERLGSNGEAVIVGQFWELKERAMKKPPRHDLCTKREAETIVLKNHERPRSTEEKVGFLTQLYNEKLAELQVDKENKKAEKATSELVSTIMQKWLDHVAALRSARTAAIYLESVNHYIRFIGDHPIEDYHHEFNTVLVEKLKLCDNHKGGLYSTANQIRHIKAIQNFFNWAYRREYISKQIKLEKPIKVNKEIEIYSMAELMQLNQHILKRIETENHSIRRRNLKNQHRAFIMAINTIMRRGAIWSLLLINIDLARRIIRIRNNPELDWVNKKNKEVNKPINDKLYDFLKRDLENRDETERYYLDDGSGHPCYKDPHELSKSFGRHCKELGITSVKPFHGIRATMITEAIRNGVDLKTVKELADHETIITTEKYTNTKRMKSEEAVKRLTVDFSF